MWLWWVISLIILIACVIFAWRMIVSSYEFLPADKRYFWKFGKESFSTDTPKTPPGDTIKKLNRKLQSVEDNSTFYQIQFTKFQERLKALEELNLEKISNEIISHKYEDKENWKELYYEENEKKERLENELDNTNQLLEKARQKLAELSENNFSLVQLQSEHEGSLFELQSTQTQMELLQRQLTAATEREKELEQLLISEVTIREKYSMLQKEYIELQSESDDLRRRMIELNKKDLKLEMRIIRLNELESKLAICEEEKFKLKSQLDKYLLR